MNTGFLERRMRELGLTLKDLNDKSGVSIHTLRLIKRGMVPGKPILQCLALALKCEIPDLVLETAAVG